MRPPAPLPDHLLVTAQVQEGLLDARQCDAAGVGSARRAALRRAGLLLPVVRGVHDAAPALEAVVGGGPEAWAGASPEDHRRCRAAWTALLALGRTRSVATGACALALLGVQGLPRDRRPEAALLDGSHRAPAAPVRVRCVTPELVQRVRGARVVEPMTALAQAVCELGREHAVAVLDSAVQQQLISAEHVDDVRRLTHGRRGSRRASGWWDLVDGRLLVAEIDGAGRTGRPRRCTVTAPVRTPSWPRARCCCGSPAPTSTRADCPRPSPATSRGPRCGTGGSRDRAEVAHGSACRVLARSRGAGVPDVEKWGACRVPPGRRHWRRTGVHGGARERGRRRLRRRASV